MNRLVLILVAACALTPGPSGAAGTESLAVINSIYLGDGHPRDLVLTPDGSTLFIATFVSGDVSAGRVKIYSTARGTPVCDEIVVGGEPAGIALSPDGTSGLVTNTVDGYHATRFSAVRCRSLENIQIDSNPEAAAFSADGSLIYVTLKWASQVAIVNAKRNKTEAQVDGIKNGAGRAAATPDGRYLYVVGRSGGLFKIDMTNRVLARTIPVGGLDVAVSPDGKWVYVSGRDSGRDKENTIKIVSTADDRVTEIIKLDATPVGLASPIGGRYLFATFARENKLAVIDLVSKTAVAQVKVGRNPRRVVASPDGRYAYVANEGETNIAVVDTAGILLDPAFAAVSRAVIRLTPRTATGTNDDRMTIAVTDLEAQGVAASSAAVASDWLRDELVKTGAWRVQERKNMEKVLAEQALQQTGCTDAECAVKLGKILNVKRMVVGTLGKFEGSYVASVRLVDVETSEVVQSETAKGETIEVVEAGIRNLARLLSQPKE